MAKGWCGWVVAAASWLLVPQAMAQAAGPAPTAALADAGLSEAREALRRNDRARLVVLRDQLMRAQHPLALWADYWELSSRLPQTGGDEVEAFYQRWPGSYVEDRLRNDWLLELGRRRDWPSFLRDLPRFRMNDDREVHCYAVVARHASGTPAAELRAAALAAWQRQADADDGCQLLGSTARDAGWIEPALIWPRLAQTVEHGRTRAARQTAALLGPSVARAVDAVFDSPARFLARPPALEREWAAPMQALAVIRMATQDPAAAALQLESSWTRQADAAVMAAAYGALARQAALRQLPQAAAWGMQALSLHGRSRPGTGLRDDTLAWIVRGQLRGFGSEAWVTMVSAIDAMSDEHAREPVWRYWKARALLARARTGGAADAARDEAVGLLREIASPLHFYGLLAAEELGEPLAAITPPAPLSNAERDEAAAHPGLRRGLQMIELGLRSEGVREWNFSLIGLDDRRLMAAAQLACDRQAWDRCISASERTQSAVNLAQRFPLPFRDELVPISGQASLDPALVYGLIRQESRFVTQARSHVGASGLMQVMPATARWTAQRLGLDWQPQWRDDLRMNLQLGTGYLRLVLDDFGGSLPMAMAAYNAGPSRPRRWREGAIVEPAAWAETIPIHETRDYVKKVLANAAIYAQRLGAPAPASMRTLLGSPIGPRPEQAPEVNKELP